MTKDTKLHTKIVEIPSSNIIEVEAGTNTPCGGDAGHGGKTYIRLSDLGGTSWQIRVHSKGEIINVPEPESVEIILSGDTEASTIIKALELVVRFLKDKSDWESIITPYNGIVVLKQSLYNADIIDVDGEAEIWQNQK